MATFSRQMTEIEFLILHGKPRAKKQGIEQARVLFNELAIQKESIEGSLEDRAGDFSDIDGSRASLEELQACMNQLYPLLNVA
jgi:hypothetical protein